MGTCLWRSLKKNIRCYEVNVVLNLCNSMAGCTDTSSGHYMGHFPPDCNFTKCITRPWVFFTFFKLYKWCKIAHWCKCKLISWIDVRNKNIFKSALRYRWKVCWGTFWFEVSLPSKKCLKKIMKNDRFFDDFRGGRS